MNQTAVEWLVKELNQKIDFIPMDKWDMIRDIVQQALAMEKEQIERMYSEEELKQAIRKARDITDGKDCFDAEDISGCTEVCTYDWKFNLSEDLIIEQFKT